MEVLKYMVWRWREQYKKDMFIEKKNFQNFLFWIICYGWSMDGGMKQVWSLGCQG